MVDGASPENRDVRSRLFETSGRRGVYPQAFLHEADSVSEETGIAVPKPSDSFTSIGDWEELATANERNEASGTFDAIFAGVERVAPGRALMGMIMAGGIVSSLNSPSSTGLASPSAAIASATAAVPGLRAAASRKSAPPASPTPAAASPTPKPPSYWVEKVSASTGDRYWWNRVSKESSWLDPREAVACPSDGPGAAAVWIAATDELLRPYFYNFSTGESRWTLS